MTFEQLDTWYKVIEPKMTLICNRVGGTVSFYVHRTLNTLRIYHSILTLEIVKPLFPEMYQAYLDTMEQTLIDVAKIISNEREIL